MKSVYWILLSLLIHLTLGAGLWTLRLSELGSIPDQVVDLTLSSPQTGPIRQTKATPSQLPKKISSPSPIGTASAKSSSSQSEAADTTSAGNHPAGDENEATPATWGEITRYPKVAKEYKAVYPDEAKKAGIDGAVVLDILIDSKGKVRDVKMVTGPGHGLNESAIEALKQFEFSPAQKGSTSVAVKIRYTYRFKLDVN